jgi:reactive intermediate/imine deaminase
MSRIIPIAAQDAPRPVGPYSQGLVADGLLFASGQLPLDTSGGMPHAIEEQALLVLENLDAVARAAGSSLADAIKLTVYMTNLGEFPAVNEVMAARLSQPYPARATIGVAALPRGARLEIEGIFMCGGRHEGR